MFFVWSDVFSFEGLKLIKGSEKLLLQFCLIRCLFLWGVETSWALLIIVGLLTSDQMSFPLRGWNKLLFAVSWYFPLSDQMSFPLRGWNLPPRWCRPAARCSLIRCLFLWGVETNRPQEQGAENSSLIRCLFLWGVETSSAGILKLMVLLSDQMSFPLRGWNLISGPLAN